MNILQAKEEVRRTIQIYFEQDSFGEYVIPYMKQRPLFLLGAPGIGKTAIIEQIAQELDIGMISYSMTHHTRQSAIGLPFIATRSFAGEKVRVSEYTMSEIIAAVYQMMEESGRTNGILFLDEINCVSETLAPAILQFLQYKTFGNHALPPGWIIVSAGNPPEYNRSVREFDVATRDRLKCIVVEEDYTAWKGYAYDRGIHAAILSFLEVNQPSFYSIRMTSEGSQYATARGWEDLSFSMKLYEKEGFPIDLTLVSQYITDIEIARKFTVFYELYVKYKTGYQVDKILSGKATKAVRERAKKASFDERIAVTEMLCESLNTNFAEVLEKQAAMEFVADLLRQVKQALEDGATSKDELLALMEALLQREEQEEANRQKANTSTKEKRHSFQEARKILGELFVVFQKAADGKKGFAAVTKEFERRAVKQSEQMDFVDSRLERAFAFMEEVWVTGRELMYFMSVLTAGRDSSAFIAKHGSEGYTRHNESLLVYDVKESLREEITENI